MAEETPPANPKNQPFEEMETLDRAEGLTRGSPGRAFPSAIPGLAEGQVFGAYRLVSRLGKGGFGEVWEAASLETGRRLALKVLHATHLSTEELQRFEREGRLAASLNHPHCVYVLGAERIEGKPTIAMELMSGGTLGDVLKRRGALPCGEAVDYALQILDGLEAAHAAGILHRDLKPSNIFLDDRGTARIGDFGLSRTLERESDLTAIGSFMGTPSYAPPEQVRGQAVDFRTDLYAFGATLYALLCGKPPFEGRQPGEVLSRILTEPPALLSTRGIEAPKGLEALILRLLAKDPAKRPRDYAWVRAALIPFSSKGLSTGSLPRRAAAFLADLVPFWLLEAMVGALLVQGVPGPLGRVTLEALVFSAQVAYFVVSEGLWGRSPGKMLLGLRVTGAAGASVRFRQILVRTILFVALFRFEELARAARWAAGLQPGGAVDVAIELGSLLGLLALVAPMRRRNGFAGLHEVASGTRVRFVRSRAARTASEVAAAVSLPVTGAERTFGPYRETGVVWSSPEERVLVAWDPGLERSVWIHSVEGGQSLRPLGELATVSPSRLRWLHGSREPGALWDAYEDPRGISLAEWVERKGLLGWPEVRAILLGVAQALVDDAPANGTASPWLSLSRIWIDGAGRARFLHFPVGADAAAASSWRGFLHQIVLLGLEGREVAEADLALQMPRATFPEHARALLERLCGRGVSFDGPKDVVQELEELANRPAEVTRRMRAASLALPLAPLALIAGIAIFAIFVMERVVPGWQNMMDAEKHVRLFRELEKGGPDSTEAKRGAIRVLLAATYGALMDTKEGEKVLRELRADVLEPLEAAHRSRGRPSASDVRDARKTLGLPDRESTAARGKKRLSITWDDRGESAVLELVRGGFAYLGLIGVGAVLLAPWFRGGIVLYLLGLTIQRADGRRSGRGRAFVRTVLAWLPFLAALGLSSLDSHWSPLGLPGLSIVAAAILGTVWALASPDRGVADFIVDTRLVPR